MNPKVICVTGSSRGIGRCVVESFAEMGHKVIINYAKSEIEAESVFSGIIKRQGSGSAMLVKADVKNRADVNRMFDQIYSTFGTCDVLINNAGINKDGPFLKMSFEEWNDVLQTILTGAFNCSQEFGLRYKGDKGHIINIGAVTAIGGRKDGANYCSARAGILNFTRCLALELAPTIMVNTVTPGFIATDEVVHRRALHVQANRDKYLSMIPSKRFGEPVDVFNTIRFLVDDASYITGQNFNVDGGYLMR
jgi:3-oxoacyl-[acyl-carrier protein] reductase